MFVGPVFHRSLALRSKGIVSLKIKTHAGKGLRLHGVAVLLISVGRVARHSVIRRQLGTAFISYLRVERLRPAEHEYIFPMVRIIDGHVPVDGVTVTHCRAAKGGKVWQDEIGDPQIEFIRSGVS